MTVCTKPIHTHTRLIWIRTHLVLGPPATEADTGEASLTCCLLLLLTPILCGAIISQPL